MRRFLEIVCPCAVVLLIGACAWSVLPLPAPYHLPLLSVDPAVGGPMPIAEAEHTPRSEIMVREDAIDTNVLLERKEEVLRAHFQELIEEERAVAREREALRRALVLASATSDQRRRADLERRLAELQRADDEIREARATLLALRHDRKRYEEMLLASLPERREETARVPPRAPAIAPPVAASSQPPGTTVEAYDFAWPVVPFRGVSAGYHDLAYRKRFGREHEAIDIPVAQTSEIRAPAGGTVAAVHDRGLGYSTVSLQHEGGVVTVYGHVSRILVREGQRVSQGEVIALSGGRPGSRGAGLLTTGPHLHFEVLVYGQPIDPLYKLPPLPPFTMASTMEDVANPSVIPAM